MSKENAGDGTWEGQAGQSLLPGPDHHHPCRMQPQHGSQREPSKAPIGLAQGSPLNLEVSPRAAVPLGRLHPLAAMVGPGKGLPENLLPLH